MAEQDTAARVTEAHLKLARKAWTNCTQTIHRNPVMEIGKIIAAAEAAQLEAIEDEARKWSQSYDDGDNIMRAFANWISDRGQS